MHDRGFHMTIHDFLMIYFVDYGSSDEHTCGDNERAELMSC